MKFNKNPNGLNWLLDGDGFYVSYNSNPCDGIPCFKSDTGGAETALCYGGEFKILNGDFRNDYETLAPQGLISCLEFYNKKKDKNGSSWTTVR